MTVRGRPSAGLIFLSSPRSSSLIIMSSVGFLDFATEDDSMLATVDVTETLDGCTAAERELFLTENKHLANNVELLNRLFELAMQLREVRRVFLFQICSVIVCLARILSSLRKCEIGSLRISGISSCSRVLRRRHVHVGATHCCELTCCRKGVGGLGRQLWSHH